MSIDKPITSGDIHFARNGESKEALAQQESYSSPDWVIGDSQVEEQEYVIFKLCENTKDGGVHLPNECDVINPKTNKIERARLLSGIESIWMKDQKDLAPDYIKEYRRTLTFPRGAKILRIPKSDTAALDFLSVCPWNVGNPKRKTGSRFEFYEYNPAKQQEEALAKEMSEIEMAIQASKEPVDSMRKHANYLGIQAFDDFGIPKSDDGIRKEYIITAKRNPTRFRKTLGSKEVEVAYLIKTAISQNLIDLGGHGGSVTWGAGGFIGKVPIGRNTHEYLIELALTNSDEGKAFLSRLNEIANTK